MNQTNIYKMWDVPVSYCKAYVQSDVMQTPPSTWFGQTYNHLTVSWQCWLPHCHISLSQWYFKTWFQYETSPSLNCTSSQTCFYILFICFWFFVFLCLYVSLQKLINYPISDAHTLCDSFPLWPHEFVLANKSCPFISSSQQVEMDNTFLFIM